MAQSRQLSLSDADGGWRIRPEMGGRETGCYETYLFLARIESLNAIKSPSNSRTDLQRS